MGSCDLPRGVYTNPVIEKIRRILLGKFQNMQPLQPRSIACNMEFSLPLLCKL